MAVTWPDADNFNRTAKQLVDSGRASSPAEAIKILERFVLQVDVGPNLNRSPAGQAALLTVINAASRAFLGGVKVRIDDDAQLTEGWATGTTISRAVTRFGGQMTNEFSPIGTTIVVGRPRLKSVGEVVLRATWDGWSGGVVEQVVQPNVSTAGQAGERRDIGAGHLHLGSETEQRGVTDGAPISWLQNAP